VHAGRRPWKRRRLWTRRLEARLGVGGVECGDSRPWNTGGRLPSVAHLHGHRWDTARADVWWGAAGAVGGGHSPVDRRDHPTRQEGRTATATKPRAGVSDEACPPGPTTSTKHLTTTPAQASPGRPPGAGTVGSLRSTTASTGPRCGGGPGQTSERMGGAGVDGRSVAEVARHGVAAVLQACAPDLRAGHARPPPVRRVDIPTPDGRPRPLGVPTVRDRVVQQACTIVIAPICAAHCQDASEGFRPKRRAGQAVNGVNEALVSGWSGVEADVASDVAPIAPDVRRGVIARRISDRRVLQRWRQGLKAGVRADERWRATTSGSPQGAVVSPLLAHRYGHVWERYWTPRDQALGRRTRDADDGVMVCRTKMAAEHARHAGIPVLERCKLTRPSTTTRRVDLAQDGCACLGCHRQPVRARKSGRCMPLLWPGQQAMQAVRQQIRAAPERRGLRGAMLAMGAQLHPISRGWRHSCRMGHSIQTFQALDRSVRPRLVAWEGARRKGHVAMAHRHARRRASGIESFSRPGRGGTCP